MSEQASSLGILVLAFLLELFMTASLASASSHTVQLLRLVSASVERTITRALEPFGITSQQFAVLQVMAEAEAERLGCGELGKRLAGPASDVTRLLDRLESGGLVSRERDTKDRRVVHTFISEKGREVVRQAAPAVRAAESQTLAALEPEQREQLAALLGELQSSTPSPQ